MDGLETARGLVEEQVARFVALMELLGVEAAAIQADDSDALLEVVGRKQALVDAIVAGEQVFQAHRARFGALVPTAPAEHEYTRLAERLTALMQEAVRRQKENETLLTTHMGDMRRKLRSLQQGRTTLNAYRASFKGRRLGHVPRFIDRQR